jgi:hypothetical protein
MPTPAVEDTFDFVNDPSYGCGVRDDQVGGRAPDVVARFKRDSQIPVTASRPDAR